MKRHAQFLIGIGCALLSAGAVLAQTYPAKPVRILVGFVPGGSTDLAARFLAQKLGELHGQQVIVENRGGAAGLSAFALRCLRPIHRQCRGRRAGEGHPGPAAVGAVAVDRRGAGKDEVTHGRDRKFRPQHLPSWT